MQSCAIFSCVGLGDGLLALVLAHNLWLNGRKPTLFHPFLSDLQSWFPHIPILPRPSEQTLERVLTAYDQQFIFYERLPWMQKLLSACPLQHRFVLNPIATLNNDYPYWEVGQFHGALPMVENLYRFCLNQLRLPLASRSNGITMPQGIQAGRHPLRVLIHPTSSREGKNWPREKFLRLQARLQKRGYQPALLLTAQERAAWDRDAPLLSSLHDMAAFVCESGFLIGNDSGMGHLASCLGLPTVTICRSAMQGQFWRPAWSIGRVVSPARWIPNLKGLRLRDTYWKQWVSVRQVERAFRSLNRGP